MHAYQSPAVADLARQLLRGPARLRLRQLSGIDFLLSVIETDKFYPIDFICHGLTGYRPVHPDGHPPEQHLIDAESLTADLVTLAEELTEDAEIAAEQWPGEFFSIGELAERFDVSTKTIFRWRRRGLVGWKFRFGDRRTRVVFPETSVRRFVARHTEMVQRGSTFSQLTRAEREAILTRARVLQETGGSTVNAVARAIAGETGRAVETIRLILKAFDEAHPGAGIFNRSRLDVDSGDLRLQLWEAWQDGASVEALAARFDRPIPWVYAALTQMRARELMSRRIEFIPSPEFTAPDAEQRVFGDPFLADPFRPDTSTPRVPADLPPYLQQLFRLPLLRREGETALFRKFNYLKYRADRRRTALDPDTCSAVELDAIENVLAEANALKNQITQANLRLVVSIAKRHLGPGLDFFEIISDGNISLMRAVDKFDYTRGFKFSTYASWAIIRNYARIIPERRLHLDRYQSGREEVLENVVQPRFDEHEDEHSVNLRGALEQMLDTLDDRESSILRQRFGLDGGGEPQTLEQIGRRFGVSKERIRQLESRAILKLRTGFEDSVQHLLGA